MNYAIIRYLMGKILILIAGLLFLPLLVTIFNGEGWINFIAFFIPMIFLAGCGYLMVRKKAKDNILLEKEGFVIVAIAWLLMSLVGAVPFIISGEIPNFFNAFFETASGFTTTGATILEDGQAEALSRSMQFWRSFTHWIGGMGVLVFILAIIPESENGSAVHILRAESPGPQVGKLVSKMKVSSRILYIIYIALTLLEFVLLWAGPDKNMTFFDSLIHAMGTAGTGGFSNHSASIAYYSNYSQWVIAIFMLVFGINFNMFYFLLIGNIKDIRKNEEMKWYFGIVLVSAVVIFFNIKGMYDNLGNAFKDAFFQTTATISTTGFGTANINSWPALSQAIIILLMISGACAGSTAGGFKISRVIISIKYGISKVRKMVSPRRVESTSMDGKRIDDDTIGSVVGFYIVYVIVLLLCALLVSIDGTNDALGNFTCSLSCISNVGPFLTRIPGSGSNFNFYSDFSKFILTLEMIAGRLEIFPILILLMPRTWKKRSF